MNISYIAGLFDGEGCVRISKSKDKTSRYGYRHGLSVGIAITQKEPLEAIQKLWGGKIYKECRHKKHWSDIYRWKCSCSEAEIFLRAVLPHCIIKKEEINFSLSFQEKCMRRSKAYRGGGKNLTDREFNLRDFYYEKISKLKGTNRGGGLRNINVGKAKNKDEQ